MTMGTVVKTGLTTSVLITEWLPDVMKSYKFKLNDIVQIGNEQLKIINFDIKNNRLEMLRARTVQQVQHIHLDLLLQG